MEVVHERAPSKVAPEGKIMSHSDQGQISRSADRIDGLVFPALTSTDVTGMEPILDITTLREEDVSSALGVSIGRSQTRLASPTTPAAEKSAALDAINGWGFFDDVGLEEQEEVLRNTLENAVISTSHDLPVEPSHDEASPASTRPPTPRKSPPESDLNLPSPWTSSPKTFEDQEDTLENSHAAKSRARASSGPIKSLGDLNLKKFLSSFSFTRPNEPKLFKDLARPKLSNRFASPWASDGQVPSVNGLPETQLHAHLDGEVRADHTDLLNVRKTQQPDDQELPESPKHRSAGSALKNVRKKDTLLERNDHLLRTTSRTSQLRRSYSDQTLSRGTSLSMVSSLGDDTRWDHISEQVNNRVKALKDSFQDSNLKLPSMPSINFSAFRPDFTYRKSIEDGSKASAGVKSMSTVYGKGDGMKKRSSSSSLSKPPKHLDLHNATNELQGDVVVMGGYRGSVLRSAEPPHRQLWVPVKVGLNIRKVNLEIGLDPEDEENMERTIFPSGMLTHIGPVDISRRLLRNLKHCKNSQDGLLRVHDYGYDWRLSPHLLSRKFLEFVEGLPCNVPGIPESQKGVTIIAHSLGGLIVRHAVNQRPELFRGVVYAGVPQHCVNILGPIRNGDEVLLSSKVLTAQVNFTMRSSFALLPEGGQCFIDKDTKEEYPVDFFNVETWQKYALSPCIGNCLPALGQGDRKSIFGANLPSLPSVKWPSSSSSSAKKPSDITDKAENAVANAGSALKPESMQMAAGQDAPRSLSSTVPLPAALAYLRRTLAETLAFKRDLAFNPKHAGRNAYPPLAVVYATNTPTVYAARVSGRDGIARSDAYDNLAFASGDGVVLARAAMVPTGYTVAAGGRVRTARGHVGLLGDLNAIGRCLNAIIKARKEGVGTGAGKVDGGSLAAD